MVKKISNQRVISNSFVIIYLYFYIVKSSGLFQNGFYPPDSGRRTLFFFYLK